MVKEKVVPYLVQKRNRLKNKSESFKSVGELKKGTG